MIEYARRRTRKWLWLAVTLGALALVGSACSASDGSGDAAATNTPIADTVPTGAEAPTDEGETSNELDIDGGDVELFVYTGADELGGEELTFADVFASGKPVVLNFWAGLCPPCRQEMPDFQATHEARGNEFVMLGVDVGPFTGLGGRDEAEDLLDELGITYPTAYVEGDQLMRDYNVFGMPTTVFLTADGTIVSAESGFMSADEIESRTQEMIDASG